MRALNDNWEARAKVLLVLAFISCGFAHSAFAQDASTIPTKILSDLDDKRTKVRIAAVAAVTRSKDKNARRFLQGMLSDKAPQVRATAAKGLSVHGDKKSITALEDLAKDEKSELVLKQIAAAVAVLRAKKAGDGLVENAEKALPVVRVHVFPVDDLAKTGKPEYAAQLFKGVQDAIKANKKREWLFAPDASEKGYGVMLRIRAITPGKQGDVSLVEVKCEMTLVSTPAKALRLASNAAAAVGVEGELSEDMKWELVGDAIDACAPALVDDFFGYALSR
ncbi:MAG: HEAT repeat domain-containing protein [Deltaproteobacteria bacterium]|nr:HEAT repeat domain-containing protein [Deltaproteobacteria bacterium]